MAPGWEVTEATAGDHEARHGWVAGWFSDDDQLLLRTFRFRRHAGRVSIHWAVIPYDALDHALTVALDRWRARNLAAELYRYLGQQAAARGAWAWDGELWELAQLAMAMAQASRY
jgi:hypothetical protein